MGEPSPLTRTLVELTDDGLWGNPWHNLSEATSDLTDEDLSYRPVAGATGPWMGDMARPSRYGARAIFRHLIGATLEAGDLLPSPAAPSVSWSDLEPFDWECGVADLVVAADVAHREARERTAALEESQLWEPAAAHGPLAEFSNAEVVAECLILHPPWHLGQLALIPKWRRMGEGVPPAPAAPSRGEVLSPCGDWPFHLPPVATHRELLLEVLRQAQEGDPWHAMERTLTDLTDEEASWPHHPDTDSDNALPISFYCLHVATCDVIYADMAFGERRNDWDWAGEVVGADDGLPPAEASVAMIRRGYEFLLARLFEASDEQLEAVHEMHHGHPMAGWQVIAAMLQHRLWHGGQIALIRDAYTGAYDASDGS
jgi:hypothetical protein